MCMYIKYIHICPYNSLRKLNFGCSDQPTKPKLSLKPHPFPLYCSAICLRGWLLMCHFIFPVSMKKINAKKTARRILLIFPGSKLGDRALSMKPYVRL